MHTPTCNYLKSETVTSIILDYRTEGNTKIRHGSFNIAMHFENDKSHFSMTSSCHLLTPSSSCPVG